jgi:glycosidase
MRPLGRTSIGRALALAAAVLSACASAPASPARVVSVRAPAASTEWWNGAVVYEVFVRSFQDSGGDGAGDLAGLTARLDYLNDGNPDTDSDLGVDAIWLMPIYPSPSYHGYDVTDYRGVNPDYGTVDALKHLVAEAHKRNVKVILDFVPNHTSTQHPWFLDAVSSSSAKRDWYVWSATDPRWGQPWNAAGTSWYPAGGAHYYAVFWSGMPDLNWRNPDVAADMAASAAFWLDAGVDGFRLDAVRYLVENGPGGGQQDQPETHAALKAFAAGVRASRPDALVVGEAWADTATIATYYGSTAAAPGGDELPLAFDFPLADALVAAVASGDAGTLARGLDAAAAAMPAGAGDAPFLTNHDQQRVATRLAGDLAKEKLAASILLTLQGTPFLYYGEEVGLRNGDCPSDECKRTPMAWDGTATGGFTSGEPWFPLSPGGASANVAAQTGDPGSVLSRYRALLKARKASPALARGGTSRLGTEANGIVAYLRTAPSETVLVAHALGGYAASVGLDLPDAAVQPVLVDAGASLVRDGTAWKLTVPPRGTGIWRLAPVR